MNKSHPISALALALAVAMGGTVSMRSALAQVPNANQLPTGGQVVAGQAQLSQTGSNVLQVNQSSNAAIINWQSFNLGSSATVNFVQPTSSSTTLNRVFDNNPSQIFGHLTAPGQVFFTNPNGMYFGPSSSVDVGGLTATTHSISDADFMAGSVSGNYHFTRNGATGSIVNAGELKAALGGYIALLAPEVRNQGLIVAQLGTVALAAGEAFTLDMQGTQLSRVQVSPATLRAVVDNASAVLAPGGLIILSAQALDHLQGSVVNNSGTLAATGLALRNGRVVLDAGSNGALNVSGQVITTNASGTGGDITVTGQTIAVQSGALLDASGSSGGGTVLVLSDVSDAAGSTSVQGTIRSTAGAGGGNGGQIETSGHTLNIAGAQIDASSTNGNQGHWLLDPIDVVIGSAEATSLVTALNSGTDVTVTTTGAGSANGDITVNNAIVSSGNSGALSLVADRNINLNAAVTLTGSGKGVLLKAAGGITDGGNITTNNGDITMWANSAGASLGGIQVSNNTSLSSSGGAITLGGSANNVAIAGLPSTSAHGTALPQGYAEDFGAGGWGLLLGNDIGPHAQVANVNIDSGGGRIAMAGQSDRRNASIYSTGMGSYQGVNVNAGSGSIDLYGLSSATTQSIVNVGIALNIFAVLPTPSKWQTNGGNITLNGIAAGTSPTAMGVSIFSTGGGPTTIENTGASSGSITINGVATGGTTNDGIHTGNANILSRSGPIALNSTGVGNGYVQDANNASNIGSLAGSDVTTSSSNIIFTADALSLLGTQAINTSDTVTVQPLSTSFTGPLNWPTTNLTLSPTISGLTIGKTSNTADITVASATTVAGPISIYGGNITTSAALASTAVNQGILLKATGGIIDGGNITTNGGDITLWANSAGATAGGIQVSNNTSLSSSGGAITLGGSANNFAIAGLPATSAHGTVLPQGYAENFGGTSGWGVVLGTNNGAAGQNTNIHLDSAGGRIAMAGQSDQYVSGVISIGVGTYEGVNVNAGNGDIALYGLSSGSDVTKIDYGIAIGTFARSFAPSKWQTNGGNIILNGTATGSSVATGVRLATTSPASIVTLENTSAIGGSVTMNGTAVGGTSNNSLSFGTVNILSRSGPIALNAIAAGGNISQSSGVVVNIGSLSGSDVSVSNSNISFTGDVIDLSGTKTISSNGTLTVQPYNSSFTSALSWPATGVALGSNISGLTLGKAGNTADITVAGAATVAGPINIYGGNITTSAALTSTAANQGVLLKATGGIVDGGNITTNNGDITLWANSAGATAGGIQISDNSILSSSGGAITLGGSAGGSIAGLPATSANGTALPQGYAQNLGSSYVGLILGTYNATGHDTHVNINSGGGRIAMAGLSNQALFGTSAGILTYEGVRVDAGTGDIRLDGASSIVGNYNAYGMNLASNYTSNSAPSLWKTNGGNISFNGIATGATSFSVGVNIGGSPIGSTVTVENVGTSGGSITLTGSAVGTNRKALININNNILSASGTISFVSALAGNGLSSASTSGYTVNVGALAGSDVTTSTSTIRFIADDLTYGPVSVNTSGTVTVQPLSTSFVNPVNSLLTNFTLAPIVSGLTIGKAGNTSDVTVGGATTVAGPINIYGGNIAINAPLTASGGNTVTLTSSGNVTDGASGFITADKLLLLGGNVTLDHASNNVATLAASGVGSLAYTDSDALAIDTVAGTNGISASGPVSVATLAGDLTLAKRVSTSNASSDAVILNAGKTAAAGSSAGGNLIVSGSATIGVGAGGTAKLYTGSVSGSSGLTALVGAGSGRFRYNSDEATSNYVTALATGVNAIYRDQPSVAASIDSQAIIYGTAPSAFTYTLGSNANGDTAAQAFSVLPTGLVAGMADSSGNYTAGSHALTAIGGISGLGYSITGVTPGALTVVPQVQIVTSSATNSTTASPNSSAGASDDAKLITRTNAVDFGGARNNSIVGSAEPTQRTVWLQVVREPAEGSSGFALVYVPSAIAHTVDGFSFGLPTQSVAGLPDHCNTRVTLPSGEPLPDWLRFDSATGAILATRVPAGGLPLRLLVLVGGKKMVLELLEAAA